MRSLISHCVGCCKWDTYTNQCLRCFNIRITDARGCFVARKIWYLIGDAVTWSRRPQWHGSSEDQIVDINSQAVLTLVYVDELQSNDLHRSLIFASNRLCLLIVSGERRYFDTIETYYNMSSVPCNHSGMITWLNQTVRIQVVTIRRGKNGFRAPTSTVYLGRKRLKLFWCAAAVVSQ